MKRFADRLAAKAADVAKDGVGFAKDRAGDGVALARSRIESYDGSATSRLKAMFSDDPDARIGIESFLVLIVDVVNEDEEREFSARRLKRTGKRRARLAGLAGLPLGKAGLALAGLYSETEIVCDVAQHHRLDLTDEQLAAHLLVLWNAAPDLSVATAAIDGTGPPVTAYLAGRTADHLITKAPDEMTAKDVVMVLWRARGLMGDVDLPGSSRLRDFMLPGGQVKTVKRAAEAQFGVIEQPKTGWFGRT